MKEVANTPIDDFHMAENSVEFKQLFELWLQQAAIDATKRASKTALLYNRALVKLKLVQDPITNLKQLKQIPYIGDKTVGMLCKKLKQYCLDEGIEFPSEFTSSGAGTAEQSSTKSSKRPAAIASGPVKKRKYIPRYRSGGYAILLALYVKDKAQMGMSKQDLVPIASRFCDKSFSSNPGSKEFYSAWDGHKQLEKHGLISISGRSPKIYVLTESGLDLAEKLKQSEGIESSPIREEANLSYDNGIRLSPESSFTSDVVFTEQSPPTSKAGNILVDSTMPNNATRPVVHDKENMILNRTKYKIWKYDEFDVKLIVDNREVKSQQERDYFQKRLETLGIQCEVRPLTLGDVIWIAKNKVSGKEVVLNCIGERKKMDDLCMSIKDGRFQEQKNRLGKSNLKHFYYIIEETGMNNDIVHEMMDSVRTAISMTMTSSKFYVRRFKDVDSTIQFLVSVTKTLSEYFINHKTNLIVMKPQSINSQNEYTEILNQFRLYFENRSTNYECVYYMDTFQGTFEKSGMLTVKEMYILMLMAIRGVSLERAIVIQLRFPTPKLLIEFYHTENAHLDEAAKKQLMEKEFSHLVGNKKIGKVCLERIYQIWGCR